MKDALDEHKKEYDIFESKSEGHGFYNDENRAEYFGAVIDFLGRHLAD